MGIRDPSFEQLICKPHQIEVKVKNLTISVARLTLSQGVELVRNGVTLYTAIANVENLTINSNRASVRFSLVGNDVAFVVTDSSIQTKNSDGTLTVRLINGSATAAFGYSGEDSEIVAVHAVTENVSPALTSIPSYLAFAIGFEPVLSGDHALTRPADGTSFFTARVTLRGELPTVSSAAPLNVIFRLPVATSATFMPAEGATLGDSGKTFTVPLDKDAMVVKAQFVDDGILGETVTLQAYLQTTMSDKGTIFLYISTLPPSLRFTFSTVRMTLTGDNDKLVPADNISEHFAKVSLPGGMKTDKSFPLTFSLPKNTSAAFEPSKGQKVSLDGTTLTATLSGANNFSAKANFVDDHIVGNEIVQLTASMKVNESNSLSSTPNSLSYTFAGFTLNLESDDADLRYPADGKTAHSATVKLQRIPGEETEFDWNVAFELAGSGGRFVDSGKSSTTVPLINNKATVKFVDSGTGGEDVFLTASIKNIDNNGTDLNSTPSQMMFTFYDPTMGGDYDHPKHFLEEDAVEGDIFMLSKNSVKAFGGEANGYFSGGFYVCKKRVSKANQVFSSYYPPGYDAKDNAYWGHAWIGASDNVIQIKNNSQQKKGAIYGNGRNCIGLELKFTPLGVDSDSTGTNNNVHIPLQDDYLDKIFEKYAKIVNGDGSIFTSGSGWTYGSEPSAYCRYIESDQTAASLGGRINDAEAVGADTARAGNGDTGTVGGELYLFCGKGDGTSVDIGGTLTLPGGAVTTFGVNEEAPLRIAALTSREYSYTDLELAAVTMEHPNDPNSNSDDYCLQNADTNALAEEYYWRQNNYAWSIRQDQSKNPHGEPKNFLHWQITGDPNVVDSNKNIDYGKDSVGGWYNSVSQNAYCTDGYIFPSVAWRSNAAGAVDGSVETNTADVYLWLDPAGGTKPNKTITVSADDTTHNSDGTFNSLVIVLITSIWLNSPFSSKTKGYNEADGDQEWSPVGGVDFYDQYGNKGHFYLNFDFPSTYYPIDGLTSRGIRVDENNLLTASFANMLVGQAGAPSYSYQTTFCVYHLTSKSWMWVDWGTPITLDGPDNGFWYLLCASASRGDGFYIWGGGEYPNPSTSEFYIGISSQIVQTSIATGTLGPLGLEAGPFALFTTKQSNDASKAREPVVLRPVWKENAFRMYGKTLCRYLISVKSTYKDGTAEMVIWRKNAPPPGDTGATFRFTKTTGAS